MVYFFWVGMLLSASVNGPLFALLSSTCTWSALSVMVNFKKAMGYGPKPKNHKINKAAEVSATCLLLGNNMSISALHAFYGIFYFFLRIVNKCNNTDTENIKLMVLTFILCSWIMLRALLHVKHL